MICWHWIFTGVDKRYYFCCNSIHSEIVLQELKNLKTSTICIGYTEFILVMRWYWIVIGDLLDEMLRLSFISSYPLAFQMDKWYAIYWFKRFTHVQSSIALMVMNDPIEDIVSYRFSRLPRNFNHLFMLSKSDKFQ